MSRKLNLSILSIAMLLVALFPVRAYAQTNTAGAKPARHLTPLCQSSLKADEVDATYGGTAYVTASIFGDALVVRLIPARVDGKWIMSAQKAQTFLGDSSTIERNLKGGISPIELSSGVYHVFGLNIDGKWMPMGLLYALKTSTVTRPVATMIPYSDCNKWTQTLADSGNGANVVPNWLIGVFFALIGLVGGYALRRLFATSSA